MSVCRFEITALAVPLVAILVVACGAEPGPLPVQDQAGAGICFQRHVIDNHGSGADGVHIADINQDSYPDIVSGWEESGELWVYLHPGARVAATGITWERVDAAGGQDLRSIEDAAFADMDLDGRIDAVVTASEGVGSAVNRRVRLHTLDLLAPLADASSWHGSVVYKDAPTQRFLSVRVAQLDGLNGADIVAVSRSLYENPDDSEEVTTRGGVHLFRAPPAQDLGEPAAWTHQRLADMQKGKTVSLLDMDGDRDKDILYSGARNVVWLENPGNSQASLAWTSHWVGTGSDLTVCDVNGDGISDIVATVGRREYPVIARWFEGIADKTVKPRRWQAHDIVLESPAQTRFYQFDQAASKSIACGHFAGAASGPADIVLTASGSGFGMRMLLAPDILSASGPDYWRVAPLMDFQWIMKYDNLLMADIDADGDQDLVTSEENEGWLLRGAGVLWYENVPTVEGRCPAS